MQLLHENEEGVGKGSGKSESGEKPQREEDASKATVGLCELKLLYAEVGGGSSKVALRLTRGLTNACINFHCDTDNDKYVLPVATGVFIQSLTPSKSHSMTPLSTLVVVFLSL